MKSVFLYALLQLDNWMHIIIFATEINMTKYDKIIVQ